MTRDGLPLHVVHDQPMAGLLQIPRHARAHDPEPNEPYLHNLVTFD